MNIDKDKLIDQIVDIAQESAFNNEYNQNLAETLAEELVENLILFGVVRQSEQLKELYNKLFMDWIEENTVYDENGFYIYKKELWSMKQLSLIYHTDILNL